MKKNGIIASLAIGIWLLAAPPLLADDALIDRIVAIVNGKAILHSEIEEKIKVGPIVLVSDYPAKASASNYEKAINDAINIELIKSFSEEMEIEVPDSNVNEHIDSLMKSQNLTKDQLIEALAEQGKTFEEYREDVRTQFLFLRFRGRVLLPQVKLTEKDVETHYRKKLGPSNQVVEMELRQLIVSIDSSASDVVQNSKKDLINEIYAKLEGGLDFIEAVKLYSDEPDAREKAGLMPAMKLANLSQTIQDALKDVSVGSYSKPVQTPLGYHIFYVENMSLSGGKEFQEQKQALEQELHTLEVQQMLNKWLESQHQRSKIEVLSD